MAHNAAACYCTCVRQLLAALHWSAGVLIACPDADTNLALLYCALLLGFNMHSVLQDNSSAKMIHKLVRTPRRQVHSYLRAAMLHVCTMAVTFPLCIGVCSLLGWHLYILLRVRIYVCCKCLRSCKQGKVGRSACKSKQTLAAMLDRCPCVAYVLSSSWLDSASGNKQHNLHAE